MILIFAPVPRCGSTELTKYIGESCKISYMLEPFHPMRDGRYNLHNLDFDLVKTLSWQLSDEDNKQLIQNADKVIFLNRTNIMDIILSG